METGRRPLTAELRTELDRAKHGKAIRVAIYDLGIFIGALYAAEKVAVFWPQYATLPITFAVGLWISLMFSRWTDWKSLEFLEQELDRDEDERDKVDLHKHYFSDD